MKSSNYHQVIKKYGTENVIAKLDNMLTEKRKSVIQSVINHRIKGLSLALERPSDINNALAAVRSSEAFGIDTINIIQPENTSTSIQTITQGAFYWTETRVHTNFKKFVSNIKQQGFAIAGAIMSAKTNLVNCPIDKPLCLLLGNEARGLSDEAKDHCDSFYSIPMGGMSESLNLSVSAAISLYETSKRMRQNNLGGLNSSEKKHLQAIYYLKTVSPRIIQTMFKI